MSHYITPEISHERDGTLVERGPGNADIVHKFASQAASVDQQSVFGSPFSYLTHIQDHYRNSKPYFYIFDSHYCLVDGNCTYIPLRVSIYRHITPSGYQYHICFTDDCKHLERNHVCRLPLGACPHSRSYSRADTYVYTSLFTCTRTGRVHLCGTECRVPFSDTSRGGVHICPLTGIALGSIMEHAEKGTIEAGDVLESIEYGDDYMIEDEDVEYIEGGPSWTDRREKQKLLTGPVFKDMKSGSKISPEEKIKLRQYRLRRANEELEKHVYTATTTLESAMRPLKVIEDTSHSRDRKSVV